MIFATAESASRYDEPRSAGPVRRHPAFRDPSNRRRWRDPRSSWECRVWSGASSSKPRTTRVELASNLLAQKPDHVVQHRAEEAQRRGQGPDEAGMAECRVVALGCGTALTPDPVGEPRGVAGPHDQIGAPAREIERGGVA